MAQLWLKNFRIILNCAMYSGILEQFYFFKSKKNLWHTWHRVKLSY